MSNDPEMQEIRNQIAFGLDAEQFMQSSIGKYLTARANADIDDAVERMKKADPFNGAELQRIQNEIHRAESFLLWMGQAVTEGENASRIFVEATD